MLKGDFMGELKVENKEVVIPGQIIAEGMDFVPTGSAYREGENVYAMQMGLVEINNRIIKVIPLKGPYVPKEGDTVIGVITDIISIGWRVNLGIAYEAVLPIKNASNRFIQRDADLSKLFDINDVIFAKISRVTEQQLIDLTLKEEGLKKLNGGRIIEFPSVKVPRLIGKNGSMITMLKKATDCKINVGKNGWIWIDGDPEKEILLIEAMNIIDKRAHLSGLTDYMKEYLEKTTGVKL